MKGRLSLFAIAGLSVAVAWLLPTPAPDSAWYQAVDLATIEEKHIGPGGGIAECIPGIHPDTGTWTPCAYAVEVEHHPATWWLYLRYPDGEELVVDVTRAEWIDVRRGDSWYEPRGAAASEVDL